MTVDSVSMSKRVLRGKPVTRRKELIDQGEEVDLDR